MTAPPKDAKGTLREPEIQSRDHIGTVGIAHPWPEMQVPEEYQCPVTVTVFFSFTSASLPTGCSPFSDRPLAAAALLPLLLVSPSSLFPLHRLQSLNR